ncbi:glycoprotease family-domain-containing protein [Achaetomium macrosporum]|uniref:N(6)-L-threonylcarbamoyladenine synthase n=1 Tax=Achaetomium macrosporum TaxID=79813 RepID=A0AAN7CHV6_9PEZI|nr:glycoprotease family-domain-containing protein [Achaetomium macrosporum]
MSGLHTPASGSGNRLSARSKDDWEDWEDDEVLTPITARDGPLLGLGSEETGGGVGEAAEPPARQASQRTSSSVGRQSVRGIRRLTSRRRQKAQNARFGIKQQHIAHQMRRNPSNRETRTGKFVDAAALKALEGATPDDSSGALNWLRRKPTKGKRVERLAPEASSQADLSPSAGPIVIGFAMPSDSDVVISPQTAVVETPVDFPAYFKPANAASPSQPVSAWSPDTDDGTSPRIPQRSHVPAVPSIPRQYRTGDVSPLTASDNEGDFPAPRDGMNARDTLTTPIYVSDDDDMATPVTLFEEDGIKGRQRSATAGSSRSQGWWDQVTSPFGPPTPATQSPAWWSGMDEKKPLTPVRPQAEAESSHAARRTPRLQHHLPEIIIEDVSSTSRSSSMATPTPCQAPFPREKPRAIAEEVRTPGELPPPYSPPSKKHNINNIRYRAVFPPGHPLNDMYPPSPAPVPAGLEHTMTSQGGISLADVPLTPPATHQPPLPDRPLGSFVPGDHFLDVSGRGPRQKAERQRRRHEKEDAVAWKAGRLWHGRGCFPCCGCFGRPGREGRKRRRVCLGVCLAMLLLTAVGVSLGVILTRQPHAAEISVPSQWLNLTNFPPIPTGISTVIGPDSDITRACVRPPSLWTCSLPKEQADSVSPFDASQPSFVIQVQFDNNTRQLWNVTGDPPRPTPSDPGTPLPLASATATRATATPTASPRAIPATGLSSLFRRLVRRPREDSASSLSLRPDPPPPSFQEMFFLGNTTDAVVSDDKAGEPTPFYISMLRSVNDTVGPNLLSRRDDSMQTNLTANQGLVNASDIAPLPAVNKDGTGAPAVLLGFPTQQPLRLYDRGLPTERYGFYSYFNKTLYVQSVDASLGDGDRVNAADDNGGSIQSESKFLITWLSVRYKVEIWTRMSNTTRLSGRFGGSASNDNNTQPGTFPYPVTVTLDTHGGQKGKKFVFARGVDAGGRIILNDARFVLNNMNTTGDLINPAGEFNPSLGGMDGGTGGCKDWPATARKQPLPAGINFTKKWSSKSLLTLAIETSCDDTCVAILEKSGSAARLHLNSKITSDNRKFGGIQPITAVESHVSHVAPLVESALQFLPPPDFISVTRGPGITSSLAIGLTMAKGMAVAWGVPLLAVHHMQAHALTPRLVAALKQPSALSSGGPKKGQQPAFPFLSLLVSGGHTQLLLSRSLDSHTILAESPNAAIGDMLDKCARLILPREVLESAGDVMYGALLETFAFPPSSSKVAQGPNSAVLDYDYTPPLKRADEIKRYTSPDHGWTLTPPLVESRRMAYDFSGLGGQVQAIMHKNPDMDEPQRRELARGTMRLAFEHLASRVIFALNDPQRGGEAGTAKTPRIKTLVVSGGVASNRFLMHVLRAMLRVRGFGNVEIVRPPAEMCTDNAAMIAWAAMEMWGAGWRSELDVLPLRKWSMDPEKEGGILGVPGFARILDAAATLIRRLWRSSCRRHCMPSQASQYWQSAAPPAMVPRRSELISITFFTVWLAIQLPAVARESVATMMPPWKRNASVVVPCAILIGHDGLERSSVAARSHAEG